MNKNTAHTAHAAVEQITNNATSWIGHHPKDNKETGRGQTFVANAGGKVETIEVYSNIVTKPGNVMMTIHSFDAGKQTWGPALSSASLECKQSDGGKWLSFNIPSLQLNKGETYGFKLESRDSFIGVGEAAGSAKHPPFSAGQEWHFNNNGQHVNAYSYFSLAFKVDIRP